MAQDLTICVRLVLFGNLSGFPIGGRVGLNGHSRIFQCLRYVVRQIVSRTQIAPDEPDVAVDNFFQCNAALSGDQLNANVQLGRSLQRGYGPPRLATVRIFLHCCLQDKEVRNIVRIAIPTTKQLFELLTFG